MQWRKRDLGRRGRRCGLPPTDGSISFVFEDEVAVYGVFPVARRALPSVITSLASRPSRVTLAAASQGCWLSSTSRPGSFAWHRTRHSVPHAGKLDLVLGSAELGSNRNSSWCNPVEARQLIRRGAVLLVARAAGLGRDEAVGLLEVIGRVAGIGWAEEYVGPGAGGGGDVAGPSVGGDEGRTGGSEGGELG